MTRYEHRARRGLLVAALLATSACVSNATAQGVPARLADSTFWRLMNEYSEPWGTFRSENFVSNETALQWVIPKLVRRVPPGGVYIGVAPDQNFTLVTALRPSIAFIVDIRHQNMLEHMMYKALFELSPNRVDFLARLFGRNRPSGLDDNPTVDELFGAYARMPRWNCSMVTRLIHNPILKGVRVRNKRISKRVNETGRRKSVNAPPSESMLPSNAKPTISPARLTTGLPELPPVMSLVVTKVKRCAGFSLPCAASVSRPTGPATPSRWPTRRGRWRYCRRRASSTQVPAVSSTCSRASPKASRIPTSC